MHLLGDDRDLDALRARARELAARWAATAAPATSVGQERAILRLFGVSGLDRAGRPLAAEVVDRYLAADPGRLDGGIALPFAMAMAEYDLDPMATALEAAAGNVDLGLEAELLADPGRRAVAEAAASRLGRGALDRIDANRTARRELVDLLGDPPRPLLGAVLGASAIVDALDEAATAIEAGAGLLRVDVPPSRELAEQSSLFGASVEPWRALPGSRGGLEVSDPGSQPIPTGSQRALAVLRRVADEAAARRHGYIRLVTDAPALAAPDQAVVAAFERIDGVVADPMREIVTGRVGPDRALADHVFAHRVLARAGTRVIVPVGPLLVAPDLVSGVPSDAATRSGRALALQLLAVELALQDGLAPAAVSVGAIPDWIVEERHAPARAAAEIAMRRALFPLHSLTFLEPPLAAQAAATWHAIVAALLSEAGAVDVILRRDAGRVGPTFGETRTAARVGASLRESREAAVISGTAVEHGRGAFDAAEATLNALEMSGWSAMVDGPLGMAPARLGVDGVALRRSAFDPFA